MASRLIPSRHAHGHAALSSGIAVVSVVAVVAALVGLFTGGGDGAGQARQGTPDTRTSSLPSTHPLPPSTRPDRPNRRQPDRARPDRARPDRARP
ncbi:MAG: hypothetical protein M3P83_02565, partial [Actinomycetota bacterium]|nr:hypothetical protein [Actinomycetota bacterium]